MIKLEKYWSIYLIRQVEPSPDNLAVQCLASDIQARNVRKVKINANVTFLIWILESLANTTSPIAVLFDYRSIFYLFGFIWYYVILPYTYLMNTSHYRKRIIDDGLVSILRNLLPTPDDFNTIRTSICNPSYSNVQNLTYKNRTSLKNRGIRNILKTYRQTLSEKYTWSVCYIKLGGFIVCKGWYS